jgi:hypothetical protein
MSHYLICVKDLVSKRIALLTAQQFRRPRKQQIAALKEPDHLQYQTQHLTQKKEHRSAAFRRTLSRCG